MLTPWPKTVASLKASRIPRGSLIIPLPKNNSLDEPCMQLDAVLWLTLGLGAKVELPDKE